jgi:DNA-binding transcriptional MocR family regulator
VPNNDNTTDTLVIENEALRKGFTIIPNYVLSNPKLSFGARLTYTLLLSYAWQQGSCFPGQETLANDLQSDPRSIRRYLGELKAQGLIKVKQRGLRRTNVYVLTDFSPPIEPDRTAVSAPDRTVVSYKENTDRTILNTVNRLAVDNVSEGTKGGFARIANLLGKRATLAGKGLVVDKKAEVAPLAEEAARKLNAPHSLGMFYKVLLQLYPQHLYFFEQAVKEAAAEPKPRVSRSALFVHIIRRLAREHGVPMSLGREGTDG